MSVSSDAFTTFANYPVAHHCLSNADLVDRFRQSDPSAFAELFARHRSLVYRVCLRFLGHHHDAEDAVQETFRRAATAIDRWDSRRPIEPWLVTIAGNRCRTLLTRRRREVSVCSMDEPPIDSVVGRAASSRTGGTQVSGPFLGGRDEESFVLLNEWVGGALSQLPDDQRKAFQLVHQEGLTYPQAARRMGRPTGTIKTWVRRARCSIRETFHRDAAVPAEPRMEAFEKNRSRRLARLIAASVASLFIAAIGYVNSSSTTLVQSEPIRIGTSDRVSTAVVDRSPIDWQFVSLEAFSDAEIDFVEMERMPAGTIPIESWIEHSTPVLGEFQQGIAPVSRTLRNVIRLFTCYHETEAINPPFNDPRLQDVPSDVLTSSVLPASELPSDTPGDGTLHS